MLHWPVVSAASSTVSSFPEKVGKYELLLPLGTGGTATVYLARTRGVAGFEREVALKLVHAHLRADEESRLHLLEEARLAARIRHPNVVSVTEVDADRCGVFLVMDYVEGETLSGLARIMRDQDQRLPPRLVGRIMNDALAGLHAAHELRDQQGELLGLVHRDFSPQNILVGIEGVTRLADFGVAKAASRTVRTKTGLVKGKVAYMSPEQARGHRVDRRCDVWAAGVVVWELITGRKLYDHEDDVATLLSVVTEEPPRLSSVMQGIPEALDDAVAFALTSDVNARCPSADAFRCHLEAAWAASGGMATSSELGAFVRQTVGDRLAERRAAAAGGHPGRAPTPPLPPIVGGPGLNGVSLDGRSLDLEIPSSAQPPPEDGTKTAISAAVPAADHDAPPRVRGVWKRGFGFATVLALAAGVALVMGIAVKNRSADGTVEATVDNAPTTSEPTSAAAPAAEPTPPPHATPDEPPAVTPQAPIQKANDEGEPPPGATPSATSLVPAAVKQPVPPRKRARPSAAKRSSRKAPRTRKVRASKPRKRAATAKRILPLPKPREQQKQKTESKEAPKPLRLAPDPYEPTP